MMPRSPWLIVWLAAWLAVGPAAIAQQASPHIGYVYPAGAQQGTSIQVVVGGQHLGGVTNAFVSGPGVQATLAEQVPALTPREANDLREKLKQLRERKSAATRGASRTATNAPPKAPWTAADEKLLAEIRHKLATLAKERANPAIGETVMLRITLGANAPLGARELRLRAERGLSNPLIFCVGRLPEFTKTEMKDEDEPRSRPELRGGVPPTETSITLPATVNGQILPGGVDRFRFPARRGQRLIAAVSARQLIPYLADAVPGWFQATMTLTDIQGHELDYASHYRFQPDPVLYCEIPKDGEYVVVIRDSLYRGREDFVYRITIGELPFVTGIFPLGGRTGTQTTVALRGCNLRVTRLTMDARNRPPGTYPLSGPGVAGLANVLPFAVDDLPECFEKEPNGTPAHAQPVTLPVIINGHIDPPGDWDVFRFDGAAGQQLVAEVRARRLNSPLDSLLKLTDTTGQQIAFNDDYEDKGTGLNTHHADSYLTANLPATGPYYLYLGDAQHQGGRDYSYRLRISAPRPDFDLRVVPASLNARAGGTTSLTVYALRRDGFTNAIAVALKDAPAGFRLRGIVPAGQDQVKLTLTAPPTLPPESITLELEGRATIQGREIVHTAVAAEDMMQAFAYRHLVPAQELMVAVAERPPPRPVVRILSATPVRIPSGGAARVRIGLPAGAPAVPVQCELSDSPDGLTIQSVTPTREGLELMLQTDATKIQPGRKGTLTVKAFVEKGPPPTKQRVPLEAWPLIPFEIVQP